MASRAGGGPQVAFEGGAKNDPGILALDFPEEDAARVEEIVEPGITPGTGLARDANIVLRFLFGQVLTLLPPFSKYRSTPERAALVITQLLVNEPGKSGVYYDEKGQPMLGSACVRDLKFQDRVVAETRALLASIPA